MDKNKNLEIIWAVPCNPQFLGIQYNLHIELVYRYLFIYGDFPIEAKWSKFIQSPQLSDPSPFSMSSLSYIMLLILLLFMCSIYHKCMECFRLCYDLYCGYDLLRLLFMALHAWCLLSFCYDLAITWHAWVLYLRFCNSLSSLAICHVFLYLHGYGGLWNLDKCKRDVWCDLFGK